MEKYRVFVSYSHEDLEAVKNVVKALTDNGFLPVWDENFRPGLHFPDMIKKSISHAHIFMPVISSKSVGRSWVHQEIGYALALNIPVAPLKLGEFPGEMLWGILPIPYENITENIIELLKDTLKIRKNKKHRPLFEYAEFPENRDVFIEYAESVLEMKFHGHVRQKGGLGSFQYPNQPFQHPLWKYRYTNRDDHNLYPMREERKVLEEHAKTAGCSLIINLHNDYKNDGPLSKATRLKSLLDFLNSPDVAELQVAVDDSHEVDTYLTIVGDWFVAGGVMPSFKRGNRQTIFTRHALTVRRYIKEFNEELNYLHHQHGNNKTTSREAAKFKVGKELYRELELFLKNSKSFPEKHRNAAMQWAKETLQTLNSLLP